MATHKLDLPKAAPPVVGGTPPTADGGGRGLRVRGSDGPTTLVELFGNRYLLLLQNVMFDPS